MPVYKDEATNTWYAQFYYKDWDGKRKHTTKRGFERKRDAQKYESEFKLAHQRQKITLGMLFDMYLKNVSDRVKLGTLKVSTQENYTSQIDLYLRPFLNTDMLVEELNSETIDNWTIKLKTDFTTVQGKPLADSSLINIKSEFGVILNFAVRRKFIASSPMIEAEKLPPAPRKKMIVWGSEQYIKFIESVNHEHYRIIFNLFFFCGLRMSEVLALTPSDINSDGTLTVRHGLVHLRRREMVLPPKTPSSARKVQLPKILYDQIVNYIGKLYDCANDEPIFKVSRKAVSAYLDRQITKLNLPRLTPHGLRHSNASLLLNKTHDIALVSERLGHKNPKVTLQRYAHMLPGAEDKATAMLNDIAETIGVKSDAIETTAIVIPSEKVTSK